MEEECPKCPPPGAPAWMATFGDLMSLLMCFFVLLLSFAEMDVLKFKQLAGSMKNAFGVQNQIEVKDIPKGTSVIALEFRPGKPQPSPIKTVMQQTIEMTEATLNFQDGDNDRTGGSLDSKGKKVGGRSSYTSTEDSTEQSATPASAQAIEIKKVIEIELEEQIENGAIDVQALGQQILIRVKEKGAFPAGSAFLQPMFRPIIREIGNVLKDVPGIITVTGHTDDEPSDSDLYRSNWDLSAQRAVSVGHELLAVQGFNPDHLIVSGVADTQPLYPNTSKENRRRNRRVDIIIKQGKPTLSQEVESLQQAKKADAPEVSSGFSLQ